MLAIIAGADTTANALTMLFYCLLQHPDVYARLQEEVDRFYPPGEDPTGTKHHREMVFLTACMFVALLFSTLLRVLTYRVLV